MACCAVSWAARYSRTSYCRARARRPDRTSDSNVEVRTGRSTTLTLPSRASVSPRALDSRPALERMMSGRSDHTGCPATHAASSSAPPGRTSSETMSRPAPAARCRHSCVTLEQISAAMSLAPSTFLMAWASAAVNGSTRTRNSPGVAVCAVGTSPGIGRSLDQRVHSADIGGYAGKDAVEFRQWFPDDDSRGVQIQLADGLLVMAVALLHHGQRTTDTASRLEEPEQDVIVRQVGGVHGRRHSAAYHSRLGNGHHGDHTQLAEVRKHFMQLRSQVFLFRHGIEIAVQAVDDNHAGGLSAILALNCATHDCRELARRQFRRIHLLQRDQTAFQRLVDGDAQFPGT